MLQGGLGQRCAAVARLLLTFTLYLNFVPVVLANPAQFIPPAWPLAVKNPYLNAWLAGGSAPTLLNTGWPILWTTDHDILGMYCSVSVDGVPYRILSPEANPAIAKALQTAAEFTPTRTSFLLQAGHVNVNATFLSPISPMDLTRQSLPFAYFYLTITSTDGQPHSVRAYTDISGEWIAGDDHLVGNATGIIDDEFVILEVQLQNPQPFVETASRPQDASGFIATKNVSGVRYQVARDTDNRGSAANATGLQDDIDPTFSSRDLGVPFFDVFGISVDLGNITSTSSPVVWAIGVARDPAIQYTSLTGEVQLRSSYYWSNFSSPHDVVGFFLDDFDNALSAAQELDLKLMSVSESFSSEYGDLVSLAVRQALSALEITVSKNRDGTYNTSDVKAFMKNMGAVGTGGVNSADVLYAAFPIFLYLNATLGGHLLRPLLEAQNAPVFSLPYAVQGLGTQFPKASISSGQHNFGIEQSANMIIMSLAQAQASGDGSLLQQYYNLLKKWSDYLVNNSFNPLGQQTSSSDGITSFNQTNLMLKGILGIGAMAQISQFMGMQNDSSTYQNVANSYMKMWVSSATSADNSHMLSSIGQQQSGGILYNLYADKLLRLNLVPESVYALQTQFYDSQIGQRQFGVPLDNSNQSLSRADWTMFAAAIATDNTTRDAMVSLVYDYAAGGGNNSPFAAVYNPTTGKAVGGVNSPTIGAIFSLLALSQPISESFVFPITNIVTASHKISAGVIAGSVIGALAGTSLLVVSAIFVYRRWRVRQRELQLLASQATPDPFKVESSSLVAGVRSDGNTTANSNSNSNSQHNFDTMQALPELPSVRARARRRRDALPRPHSRAVLPRTDIIYDPPREKPRERFEAIQHDSSGGAPSSTQPSNSYSSSDSKTTPASSPPVGDSPLHAIPVPLSGSPQSESRRRFRPLPQPPPDTQRESQTVPQARARKRPRGGRPKDASALQSWLEEAAQLRREIAEMRDSALRDAGGRGGSEVSIAPPLYDG